MPVEDDSKRFEEYLAMDWVLATTSLLMAETFRKIYQDTVVATTPAIKEPKKGRSRRAATAKNNQVSALITEEMGTKSVPRVVFSADVAYVWNGETQHRPDRDRKVGKKRMKSLQEEVIARYSVPFSAEWQVSFAAHVLHTGLRRLLTLKIPINSSNGIKKEKLKGAVDPSSNALVRLAEIAQDSASFMIAHKDDGVAVPLDPEIAILLVAAKMLPENSLSALLTQQGDHRVYWDREGNRWEIPALPVQDLFSRSRQ